MGNYARTRQLDDTVTLKGQSNEIKAQLTARQVLAFVEAKDVIARQIGRSAKLLVCSDEMPNAFATRGKDGDVMGVTVGMLKLLDGDRDAAAMIVGHEFAHHHKSHMEAGRGRDAVIGLLGTIAGVLLESKLQRKTGVQGLGLDLADMGSTLVSRKFDRDQEREADELGFKYMVDSGFNPKGALRLSERMARLGRSSGLFFDSHPGWNERAGLIRQYIAASDSAREIMAKSADFTPFASVKAPSKPEANLVALYESTDSEKSFVDAMEAFRRNEAGAAVVHLRAAATAGHAKAQLVIGNLMLSGRNGVEKNEVEAVRMFKLAAEQGEPTAINNLGYATSKGLGGVMQSDGEALDLYRRAMELGNGLAAKNIGDAHARGTLGMAKDLTLALALYRRSDELGHADGAVMVGIMYEAGEGGLDQDLTQALSHYGRAAERGSAFGRYRQGLLLLVGREPIAQDEPKGLALIRQAADQGLPAAQNDLGSYYKRGIHGLAQSDIEAVRWYRASAQQGFAVAQANFGFMHLSGLGGLFKDAAEAARWFKLAADQGNVAADYGFGLLNEFGEGGFRKDRDAAIALYRRAAEQGHKQAADRLKKLGV